MILYEKFVIIKTYSDFTYTLWSSSVSYQ